MGYSKFSDGVSVDAIGRAQMQGQATLLAHLLELLKDHPRCHNFVALRFLLLSSP